MMAKVMDGAADLCIADMSITTSRRFYELYKDYPGCEMHVIPSLQRCLHIFNAVDEPWDCHPLYQSQIR